MASSHRVERGNGKQSSHSITTAAIRLRIAIASRVARICEYLTGTNRLSNKNAIFGQSDVGAKAKDLGN